MQIPDRFTPRRAPHGSLSRPVARPLPASACPFKGDPLTLKGFFPLVIWVKGYIPDLMLGNIDLNLYFYLGFNLPDVSGG
jgi:hypothetical protein